MLRLEILLRMEDFFAHQVDLKSKVLIVCILLHAFIMISLSSIFILSQEIKYAKPKRGKTATGVWKDIVNVDDYTQTLRMEKCL